MGEKRMPRYGSGKDTTCGYKKIDVGFLQKNGYLDPDMCFSLLEKERKRCGFG